MNPDTGFCKLPLNIKENKFEEIMTKYFSNFMKNIHWKIQDSHISSTIGLQFAMASMTFL